MKPDVIVGPQPGFQEKFLSSPADIVIGGGAAGSGKTRALLMAPLAFVQSYDGSKYNHAKFGAAIFRRSYSEITMAGGMWDESQEMYYDFGAVPKESKLTWIFPSGARISFEHLGHELELYKYHGAQFNMIGLDEVTHFSKKSFFYLLTRNRSVSGIKPFLRATCNPDPDSFVAELIGWWINQDTGYPIPERDGVIRYFMVDQDRYVFGSTKKEVYEKCRHLFVNMQKDIKPEDLIKSLTFIGGNIYGNKILLETNPQYLSNLMALDEYNKMQLLHGNWKVRVDGLSLFNIFRIRDMFSAIIPEGNDQYYVTIDHARFGRDLCVMMTWKGYQVLRIDVMTKSDTKIILDILKVVRSLYRPLPVSNVVIDQDGIGVADMIGCELFKGGGKPRKLYLDNMKFEPNFQNLKTQCYHHMADKVNAGMVSININNVYVDGHQRSTVILKGAELSIKQLIIDDLRVIKREKPDSEGKQMITSKEQHKNALDGRSPDFGDAFMMRAFFDLVRRPLYLSY